MEVEGYLWARPNTFFFPSPTVQKSVGLFLVADVSNISLFCRRIFGRFQPLRDGEVGFHWTVKSQYFALSEFLDWSPFWVDEFSGKQAVWELLFFLFFSDQSTWEVNFICWVLPFLSGHRATKGPSTIRTCLTGQNGVNILVVLEVPLSPAKVSSLLFAFLACLVSLVFPFCVFIFPFSQQSANLESRPLGDEINPFSHCLRSPRVPRLLPWNLSSRISLSNVDVLVSRASCAPVSV